VQHFELAMRPSLPSTSMMGPTTPVPKRHDLSTKPLRPGAFARSRFPLVPLGALRYDDLGSSRERLSSLRLDAPPRGTHLFASDRVQILTKVPQ
jgi:hypothetical protein